MSKSFFSIIILISISISLQAQKVEFEDKDGIDLFIFNMTGNRTELGLKNNTISCSNKLGNRTYLNSKSEIIYRASVKPNHISLYTYPGSKQLYRIALKKNRYSISSPNGLLFTLRVDKLKGSLSDKNGKNIASAHYNSLSNNIKGNSNNKHIIYKWPKANFAGLLWFATDIEPVIKMILIHEILTQN
jgi:hypothetical protein